jgi:uncharacterized protein (DUF2062 family)
MHRHYRRIVFRLYRRFRHPRLLKNNRFMRWFARHFLDKTVWKPTRHTFAGGLAVGLFVMMLVIPGQMPLAMLLCGLMRVNIPIAIIACWITNPVTMAPVAWWEVEFGNWFIGVLGLGNPPPLDWNDLEAMLNILREWAHGWDTLWEFFGKLKPWAASLYIGGVMLGAMLAPVGYALSYLLWDVVLTLTHRRVKDDSEISGDGA